MIGFGQQLSAQADQTIATAWADWQPACAMASLHAIRLRDSHNMFCSLTRLARFFVARQSGARVVPTGKKPANLALGASKIGAGMFPDRRLR
jgi:hypothetical protein